jgi:hypothetical protein
VARPRRRTVGPHCLSRFGGILSLGPNGSVRWFGDLKNLSRRRLCPLAEDAHGQYFGGSETAFEAIIPDFSKPDPLVTFTTSDIAFTYGSK